MADRLLHQVTRHAVIAVTSLHMWIVPSQENQMLFIVLANDATVHAFSPRASYKHGTQEWKAHAVSNQIQCEKVRTASHRSKELGNANESGRPKLKRK